MYIATKRLVRESSPASNVPKDCRSEDERKLEAMSITFDEHDICNDEHYNGLVIFLTINNYLLKRVIVHGDSSGNILFKSALKGMGLGERDMTKKSMVLVGFSGET